jgi:hypothetical protein
LTKRKGKVPAERFNSPQRQTVTIDLNDLMQYIQHNNNKKEEETDDFIEL